MTVENVNCFVKHKKEKLVSWKANKCGDNLEYLFFFCIKTITCIVVLIGIKVICLQFSKKKIRSKYVKLNLNSSNTDGSFNMAVSNFFLNPYEIHLIAQENKYSWLSLSRPLLSRSYHLCRTDF